MTALDRMRSGITYEDTEFDVKVNNTSTGMKDTESLTASPVTGHRIEVTGHDEHHEVYG